MPYEMPYEINALQNASKIIIKASNQTTNQMFQISNVFCIPNGVAYCTQVNVFQLNIIIP